MRQIFLKKKNANTLVRHDDGSWSLDNVTIDQERAITELMDAVEDLGYWCQVAKDVLPEEDFQMVQESYLYDPESGVPTDDHDNR